MSNEPKCNIKEPHSHLVHGQTFECEKGQPDNNMSQPQLSVREKARYMFNERFLRISFGDGTANGGGKGLYFVPKENLSFDEIKDFIDQIITLAQEEKIKEIKNFICRFKIGGKGLSVQEQRIDNLLQEIADNIKQ